jgi:xylulose-5-phosphate/fructose-6-phosphate phosphoketolase
VKQTINERLVEHKIYIREHGQDMPEIASWRWRAGALSGSAGSTEADNV